jgi:hypothetical protein
MGKYHETVTECTVRSHAENRGAKRCSCDACAFGARRRSLEDVEKIVRQHDRDLEEVCAWLEDITFALHQHGVAVLDFARSVVDAGEVSESVAMRVAAENATVSDVVEI